MSHDHDKPQPGCGCCSPYLWPLMGPRRDMPARREILGGAVAAAALVGGGMAEFGCRQQGAPSELAGAALAGFGRGVGSEAIPDGPPDVIYRGARIITMDDDRPGAQALASSGGRITAVGSDDEMMALAGTTTRIDDLDGLVVLPGFIDGHGHLASTGMYFGFADLQPPPAGPVQSIADLQQALRRYRDENDGGFGGWLLGAGYDESLLVEQRHPDRDDLDAVSTDHPIFIWHVSGHLAVANSKALDLAGVTPSMADPDGGVVRRRPGGTDPCGIVEENALLLFQDRLPEFKPAHLLDFLDTAQRNYAAWGITTAQDGATRDYEMDLLRAANAAGRLDLDVVAYPLFDSVAALDASSYVPDAYDDRLRLGGAKLMLDGSPQGKTAWLTEPYLIPPVGREAGYAGYPLVTDDDLAALVEALFERGWQVLAHCNGDAAGNQFIDAVAKATERCGSADRRPVMIHAQMARDDQLDRMAALGMMASFFVTHTFYWGDWHRDSVMGPERAARISPTASARARDVRFTLHNDSPVVPSDSRMLLWSAINRQTRSGAVLGPDQQINVETALKAMTIEGAYQHFEDDLKGTITPGKLTDLVILADDPYTVDASALKDIEIVETIKEDKPIFSAR